MADPTQYDLVQDSRLDSLESLVTPQPKPTPGVEYSFPVVGQDISDSEYRQMMKGLGSGIIDSGDNQYWIRKADNATDTIQLTVGPNVKNAESVIAGFFHRLVADMTLSIPPVTTATTYNICLTLDPLQASNPAGPISVQVYAGAPPSTQGKIHIILWTGTRQPNSVLTSVQWTRRRQRVAPVLYVWAESHKPAADQVLWGTLCIVGETRRLWRSTNEDELNGGDTGKRVWVPMDDDTGWVYPGYITTYEYAGHGREISYRHKDGNVQLRGRFKRENGGKLTPSDNGWWALTLPKEYTPIASMRFITAGQGFNPPTFSSVEVTTNGQVRVYPTSPTDWGGLDGISIGL